MEEPKGKAQQIELGPLAGILKAAANQARSRKRDKENTRDGAQQQKETARRAFAGERTA